MCFVQAPVLSDAQQPTQPWQSLVLDMRHGLNFPKRGQRLELDVKRHITCRCLSDCSSLRASICTICQEGSAVDRGYSEYQGKATAKAGGLLLNHICWCRAFRLDILRVRGPNPDGVQLANLELFALRQ